MSCCCCNDGSANFFPYLSHGFCLTITILIVSARLGCYCVEGKSLKAGSAELPCAVPCALLGCRRSGACGVRAGERLFLVSRVLYESWEFLECMPNLGPFAGALACRIF